MSDNNPQKLIAVEGPIGVGKTTLARKLAEHYQAELLLENAEENPFLPRFYQDPKSGALPTQLYFLFQRAQQLKELKQSDMFKSAYVSDFLMDKDKLFAQLTLDSDELALYQQVYDNLTIDTPTADLVIYLQAPVDILLERIRKRSSSFESTIQREYLVKICDAYMEFFHYYQGSPLLIVNTNGFDLVDRQDDYQRLIERITETTSGRHYFNPKPDIL
ncbi:deoxynucleoside kinase [Pleionea sediminis]|uniref:deoxynucleoside kinase n=1 Tax=Pleionea sediminis TaxID=2569479 RepID=UPI001FE33B1C|nr:deoxynucleoside kinase [Pleionea sediminis]